MGQVSPSPSSGSSLTVVHTQPRQPFLSLPLLGAGACETDYRLSTLFTHIAKKLTAAEKQIVAEMIAVQGKPVDIGGYYQPDDAKASAALRPSKTLNEILGMIDRGLRTGI